VKGAISNLLAGAFDPKDMEKGVFESFGRQVGVQAVEGLPEAFLQNHLTIVVPLSRTLTRGDGGAGNGLVTDSLKWPRFCRQLEGRFVLNSGGFMVSGFPG